MDSPECYFYSLAEELLPKRELMAKFLSEVGMIPTVPEGGYFMIADWSPLGKLAHLNRSSHVVYSTLYSSPS